MTKLIELWKTGCGDCEKLEPTLSELEKEGYEFDRFNITSTEGKRIINEYQKEIIELSKKRDYKPEYLYTPTLINPETREVLFYPDKPPTKEELIKLAS